MFVKKCVGLGLATVGSLALVGSVVGAERMKLYGSTGERLVRERLDAAEGTATKLELLKTKVRDLDGEVVRLGQEVAARRIEVETTDARLQESGAALEHQKKVLARAAELLDEGRASYEICGHRYARGVVEEDARAKLEGLTLAERSLEEEKKVAAVKARTLELSRAHLERATKRRGELAQAVRSIEARLAQQQAKRALADALDAPPLSAEVQGELAKAERLAKEVEQKLAVEERVLDERLAKKDGPTGLIDYESPRAAPTEDLARAIREHLAAPRAEATPAAPAAAASETPARTEIH